MPFLGAFVFVDLNSDREITHLEDDLEMLILRNNHSDENKQKKTLNTPQNVFPIWRMYQIKKLSSVN